MPNYRRYYTNEFKDIFITMVTHKRQKLLVDNIELLRQAFTKTMEKYKFKILAICIMHDHIHMLIEEPELKNYSKIVGSIKKYFSYYLNKNLKKANLSESQINRKEPGIWQRRFYDHIIRNEKDFEKHFNYIHYNPYKHYQIAPKDWEYSTFKKFVEQDIYPKDWCDFDDETMDIE